MDLPTYAFQRQRYWPEPVRSVNAEASGAEAEFWAAVENGDLDGLVDTLDVDDRSLGDVLPALASWRRRERDESVVADWRYRITWTPVTEPGSVTLSGTWLVVGESTEVATALSERGGRVVTVDPDGADRRALAETLSEVGEELSGVLSVSAFDETPLARNPVVSRGVAGTLGLVQALGDAGIDAPLWILTRGAVATGSGEVLTSPVQAQAWGLGRVAGLEHPDRWGGLIDLPQFWDERTAARLCGALVGGTEDQIAVRSSGVLARRLIRAAAHHPRGDHWKPRGTVLLTGGTGSTGGYVGRWLASRGADRLVLAGRSGAAAPGVPALIADLVTAGTGVDVLACDTAERAQVAGMLDRIATTGSALTAVLHAANTAYVAPLDETDEEGLSTSLGAKAAGAYWLDELTAELDLEAFVLFSSIAATWGSNDHGAYAAGNAFLDALADNRRARGLPGTSIAWGVWDTRDWDAVDAVADQTKPGSVTPAKLLRQGMNFLDPDRALTALGQVLDDDETFLAFADVDWDRFAPVFTAARERPLLNRIPEVHALETTVSSGGVADGETSELADRLVASGAEERIRTVAELIRTHAAVVLGHVSAGEVPAGQAFRELGFDSLTAVELRNRLNTATGLTLPSTVVFDYPTPTGLAEEIVGQLFGVTEVVPPAPVFTADPAEPIAIVGMGCRYAGDVDSPGALWDLLSSGGDAVSGFPVDRGWDVEGLFDPDPDNPGTSYVSEGGFLRNVTGFDADFFGISPREALAMDPQQRLLLEVTWETLEHAGIDPETVRGSRAGVFAGAASSGYGTGITDEIGVEGHLITGNSGSVLSGRVSYVFGLEGPAVTVDTACSSSLVALHQAVQSLRLGECSLALAGGVMVMADAGGFVGFSRQRVLAGDGRCKAFSADADGMGMAEGVGLVLLERLSDARRNGRRVLGVVRGSAVNQDGASNGLTAPNGPSQQRVIRAALADAGLSVSDVGVVEAHGTGTALGDPIEAQAVLATYGQEREDPVWLGSVKSNIGHAQQAAGVAGVMKMVLAFEHGVLPATLHVDEPSPHVDWSSGRVELLTEPVDWGGGGDRRRRAGVSAFGISGTNAHVILEEAPVGEAEETGESGCALGVPVWPVSGRSAGALVGQAVRLREFVLANPDMDPVDVGWSLAVTRSVFAHRAVVTGTDRDELLDGLAALAAGRFVPGVVSGVAGSGRVGFVFAGQGSQRAGMGRELYASSRVFAEAFDQACALIEAEVGVPVREVVLGDGEDERADQTLFAQAGLFAVEVGLVALLACHGVCPDVVVGHSVGEIAAAYVAGVLSLSDAVKLVAARARLMQALPEGGAMAAIAATEQEIRADVAEAPGVGIAAVNGPSSVVISGDAGAVEEIAERWRGRDRRVRWLRVSHAFHSHHMDPVLDELAAVATGLRFSAPEVPWAGALTGELVDSPDASYWPAQAREPVRLADALETLADQDVSVFIEIGPDGTLSSMGSETLSDSVFIPLLRKETPAEDALRVALSRAHVHGVDVDWSTVLNGHEVELPAYAFQRSRFWPERAVRVEGSAAESGFWTVVENGDASELADKLNIDGDRPFREVLPALASWRRSEREDTAITDWRYHITWESITEPTPTALTGTWLLVGESTEVGEALTKHGATVVPLPAVGQDRARFADTLSDGEFAGVVSLLALDETSVDGSPVLTSGLAATLALTQALGDAGVTAPLWVVTRGAVAIGPAESPNSPIQAQVWGFGRVVGLEHPDRWGGLVDLPETWDQRAADRLCAVLADAREDQVALRTGGAFARRLSRAPRPRSGRTWTPGGSVLVTGGTGGIGGHVGRWLAERSAPRIVLTSRSGPAADGVAELADELATAGTAVQVLACDTAERTQLAGVLDRIAAGGPPLTGVVHAAGVGQGVAVADMDATVLADSLSGKAAGAVWLDELTAGMDLETFVLFSSISATWGSALQPGYAAANAFLDALAESRRARGEVATALAWGVWHGAGMGAGEASDQLRRFGLSPMDPRLGIRALAQAVDARECVVAVADVDWPTFAPTFSLRRPSPLIGSLPEAQHALTPAEQAPGGAGDLAERLTGLPRADQDRLLVDLVRTEAAAVLGHTSGDAIGADRAFGELGFDSLTSVELRNRLNAATGRGLPATLVFDHPNAEALAAFLRAETLGGESGPDAVFANLDRLETGLFGITADAGVREDVTRRLRGILANLEESSEVSGSEIEFDSATPDEVFSFLDNELGSL
ncbi:type I polyketide synthase [Sciscionella marina]|uniref:type I polyketide synthase n=1 Tax=Sciscionella marina TaxID=508770 RepID=UPI001969BA05|nr:type I polyketide synthase [Sciscionella marina]